MGETPKVVDQLRTAAVGLTRAIDVAHAMAAWEVASPCDGWSVGDVADHIIGNYIGVASAVGVSVAPTGERPTDWAAAREALLTAATHEGALDTVVDGPDGPTPLGRLLAVFVLVDTLVHTWDI